MSPAAVKQGAFARHFEGWQSGLAALAIGLVVLTALAPWSVEPRDLPLPIPDARALAKIAADDERRATETEAALAGDVTRSTPGAGLYDLRALGSAIRAYGRVDAGDSPGDVFRAREALVVAAERAKPLGDDALVGLRALELRAFVRAVRAWESSGRVDDDLRELGGGFVAMVERNGWVDPGRRLLVDERALAAMWKRRWNEITHLSSPALAPSVDEDRAFYAFVLARPVVTIGTASAPSPETLCRVADEWRARRIEELGARDPAYPLALAKGVLAYRLGSADTAAQYFRAHLEAHPDGPFALRARAWLRAAVAHAP